ncbi:unnamed protein product [Gordionus sp. m RMFG-2023]|uniref:probable serine/threonine-protein kinase clkA n=1 Tax=Gordionus sp. m RMFG-2023 TaxID=3053472 RepID=UPI0030E12F43
MVLQSTNASQSQDPQKTKMSFSQLVASIIAKNRINKMKENLKISNSTYMSVAKVGEYLTATLASLSQLNNIGNAERRVNDNILSKSSLSKMDEINFEKEKYVVNLFWVIILGTCLVIFGLMILTSVWCVRKCKRDRSNKRSNSNDTVTKVIIMQNGDAINKKHNYPEDVRRINRGNEGGDKRLKLAEEMIKSKEESVLGKKRGWKTKNGGGIELLSCKNKSSYNNNNNNDLPTGNSNIGRKMSDKKDHVFRTGNDNAVFEMNETESAIVHQAYSKDIDDKRKVRNEEVILDVNGLGEFVEIPKRYVSSTKLILQISGKSNLSNYDLGSDNKDKRLLNEDRAIIKFYKNNKYGEEANCYELPGDDTTRITNSRRLSNNVEAKNNSSSQIAIESNTKSENSMSINDSYNNSYRYTASTSSGVWGVDYNNMSSSINSSVILDDFYSSRRRNSKILNGEHTGNFNGTGSELDENGGGDRNCGKKKKRKKRVKNRKSLMEALEDLAKGDNSAMSGFALPNKLLRQPPTTPDYGDENEEANQGHTISKTRGNICLWQSSFVGDKKYRNQPIIPNQMMEAENFGHSRLRLSSGCYSTRSSGRSINGETNRKKEGHNRKVASNIDCQYQEGYEFDEISLEKRKQIGAQQLPSCIENVIDNNRNMYAANWDCKSEYLSNNFHNFSPNINLKVDDGHVKYAPTNVFNFNDYLNVDNNNYNNKEQYSWPRRRSSADHRNAQQNSQNGAKYLLPSIPELHRIPRNNVIQDTMANGSPFERSYSSRRKQRRTLPNLITQLSSQVNQPKASADINIGTNDGFVDARFNESSISNSGDIDEEWRRVVREIQELGKP